MAIPQVFESHPVSSSPHRRHRLVWQRSCFAYVSPSALGDLIYALDPEVLEDVV